MRKIFLRRKNEIPAFVAALYAGGLLWLHHLGSVPVPGRFLAEHPSDRAGGRQG